MLIVRINRFFITNIRNYFYTHAVYTKGNFDLFYIPASVLRGYSRKEKRLWGLNDISYMIFKCRGDTNREGNNVTNMHMTRGP
jgi:hypothetical protein